MTGDLVSLYTHHRGKASDKWASYLEVYDRLFEEKREQPVRLLEIGVQNGGSLEIWTKYFTDAVSIIGCDIDPRVGELRFDDGRISVVVGDATDAAVAAQILELCPAFDVIIDDGSHKSSDIVRAFLLYFDRLAPGGIYVVEDLVCSYWQAYEGGLFAPAAAMQFFLRLVDYLNREAWGVEPDVAQFFAPWGLSEISHRQIIDAVASIEFHPSLCIIHKAVAMPVGVGVRVVAGDQFLVSDMMRGLAGQCLTTPSQIDNPYARPTKTGALSSPVALPLIQIYLASEQEGFCEAHSVGEKMALDGRRHVLDLRLPVDNAPPTRLRLDPANQPSVIGLHGLRLVDGEGNELWRWHGEPDVFREVLGCVLRPVADGVVVICYNDDPQFELAISPEVLARAGPGAVFCIEMTPRPLLGALPDLLQAPAPAAMPVGQAAAGVPAQLSRELAETAALFKQVVERRNATINALQAENEALKTRQQALEARVLRAEAQLEVLKEFTLSAFGKGIERI